MGRTKRYETIRDRIMVELLNGSCRPGDFFATDELLCRKFAAGRNTIRHAVKQLVAAGLLECRRHVGIVAGKALPAEKRREGCPEILLVLPSWSYVHGNKYELELLPALTSGKGLSKAYRVEVVPSDEIEKEHSLFPGVADCVCALDPGERGRRELEKFAAAGGRVIVPSWSGLKCENGCRLVGEGNPCLPVVRHFYDLGHRNIGMICHFAGHQANWKWMTSFIRAMNEIALPILPGALCDGIMFDGEGGEIVERVTAWICVNRRNLNHILDGCRKRNLHIPGDVSVVSTDEPENPELGIANLQVDFQDMARCIDKIMTDYAPGDYPVKFHLDPRGSVGPAKPGKRYLTP